MKQEEVAKVVEEVMKHLPGKHDQQTHSGRQGDFGDPRHFKDVSSKFENPTAKGLSKFAKKLYDEASYRSSSRSPRLQ